MYTKIIRTAAAQLFLCVIHSLGGVIVKEALRQSQGSIFQPQKKQAYEDTYGVIFLGTPHRGSNWAPWARLAANLTKLALQSPGTNVLRDLQVDSALLQIIAEEFHKMVRSDKIRVYSFREEKSMLGVYGLDAKVVDDFSSTIGDPAKGQVGIDANHTQMCRFASLEDPGYKKLLGVIEDFVKGSQQQPGGARTQDFLSSELDKLPRSIKEKLVLDMAFNKLRTSEDGCSVLLSLPLFREAAFEAHIMASSSPSATVNFGSCAFELAHMLRLLPGQEYASLFETETMPLAEVFRDTETYYCRCSRDAIFRLITLYVESVTEHAGQLLVRTTVGLFTLIPTPRRLLVHLNRDERASSTKALENQDYFALKKCASGQWLVREGDEIDYTAGEFSVPGSQTRWMSPHTMNILLLLQNLQHPNSVYFFSHADYQELEFQAQFSSELGEALIFFNERNVEQLRFMNPAAHLFAIMSRKKIIDKRNLGTHIAAVKMMVSDALRRGDSGEYTEPPVAASGETSEVNASQDLETRAVAFVFRCNRLFEELEGIYRATRTRPPILARLTSALVEDKRIAAGQFALATLVKGNADFILHRAIPAPSMWLEILTAPEGMIYIG